MKPTKEEFKKTIISKLDALGADGKKVLNKYPELSDLLFEVNVNGHSPAFVMADLFRKEDIKLSPKEDNLNHANYVGLLKMRTAKMGRTSINSGLIIK